MTSKEHKSKLGELYTDEVVNERALLQGFYVTSIDRDQIIPYVYAECSRGHKRQSKASEIKSMVCLYCEGRRHTLETAKDFFNEAGYDIETTPPMSKDNFGNTFLKAGTRVDVKCDVGHVTPISISEFSKGRRCTKCAGTYRNHGYSRSEVIISLILTYNNIYYERQRSTGAQFGNKLLDFYLPQLRVIIEYDGAQHVYGRSTDTDDDLASTIQSDKLRDDYARHIGYQMIRIPHTYGGRALVPILASQLESFGVDIDIPDTYYDDAVRDVFNYSSMEFGWLSYEDIKHNADAYLRNSLSDSASITGSSETVIAKHFKWVYGVNKEDFGK